VPQARVPELSHILSAPAVTGALETLLGPGALQYPHRYCHNLEPAESDEASRSFNFAQTGTPPPPPTHTPTPAAA
jgi:hypothetical protein